PRMALSLPEVQVRTSDEQALRLVRILSVYRGKLPVEELVVLRALCLLRKPVSISDLESLIGILVRSELLTDRFWAPIGDLRTVLHRLENRGLLTLYGIGTRARCTMHPAIRAYFSTIFGKARSSGEAWFNLDLSLDDPDEAIGLITRNAPDAVKSWQHP